MEARRALELESVVQRFEAVHDEDSEDEEENSTRRYFEEDLLTSAQIKDRDILMNSFDAQVDANEEVLQRPKAAKFLLAVSKAGFFSKSKRHLEVDEVKEIFDLAIVNANGFYTRDALFAAAYAYRDRTSITKPGDEAFDRHLEKELRLSKDEEYRFRIACSVATGTTEVSPDDKVPLDRLDEVFQALGYTMLDEDLHFIAERSDPDEDGSVKVDYLLSAFEAHRESQLPLHALKALYASLLSTGHLSRGLENDFRRKVVGSATLPHETLVKILNDTMGLHGSDQLTKEDAQSLVDEISSNHDRRITFRDFVRLFVGQI